MSSLLRLRIAVRLGSFLGALVVAQGGALSEPVSDQLLAGVKVAERDECAVVKI